MSDFRAKIVAELDTSKFEKDLNTKLAGKKVTLNNVTFDTKGLAANIQKTLDGHQFTLNLTNVKVDNLSKTITGQMRSVGKAAGVNLADSIKNQLNSGGIESSIAKVTAQYEKLGATGHSKLLQIKSDIQQLNVLQGSMATEADTTKLIADYTKYNEILTRVRNSLVTVSSEGRSFVSSMQIETLDNKMVSWLEKNSRASKNFGSQIQTLRNNLAELQRSGNATTSELKQIENEFNNVKTAATSVGQTGKSFVATFESGFKSIMNYVSISTIIYQGINALKQMYENVYNIDKEMTELRKVTDETAESYSKFLKDSAVSAKEIGSTITGLISSTADFARLGYSFTDSQDLAKVANIYSVVGDEIDGIDTATKSLISTMTAFRSEMSETETQGEFALSIVDKFNEIGNNFAISSGGIGNALERSASSLSAANNTLDESIALITAANTVVQDPESVGTAFKVISMRIRGAKTELEEAGLETDGMVESTAKLRAEIEALSGVDIMLDEDTFKSTYDILDELAAKWGDLTDIQQASITELIAGKRQGNVVSSLMENFDIAREAIQQSAESTGSAMAEHEKWMQSLEAKVNQLKATWEGLSQAFMDDSFLKGLVDAATTLLDILTKVVDTFGTLPTLITAAMIALSFKNVGELNNQFQFWIILRIEYAHKVFTNSNMNDITLKLVA